MIWTFNYRQWVIAGLICMAGLAAHPGAAAPEATSAPLTANIPTGPADENLETSRGLSLILKNCLNAYIAVDAMHAEGTYVTVSKSEDEETTYVQAHVTLDFERPDRIAVICDSDSDLLDCSFIADGSTVTMIYADQENYVIMPQPDSLGAYSDFHRAGEIYSEYSGAIGMSAIGQELTSENPYEILHEGIARYIYEGEETLDGKPCHRIRFVQEAPDVIVNLWIDKESALIRKSAFISSYDEDYNFVESFEEGAIASMMIMTWDSITTNPEMINEAAFKTKVPPGYTPERRAGETVKTIDMGFWESLVSTAAKKTSEPTTWSLTRRTGNIRFKLDEYAEFPNPIINYTSANPDGKSEELAVAADDGTITIRDRDGQVKTTVSLGQKISMFEVLDTASSGPLLLTVGEKSAMLYAHNLHGELVWKYGHPFATIRDIAVTTSPEHAVYLTLAGDAGIRKLNEHGEILFANSKVSYIGSMTPAPPHVDRVLYWSSYELGILDKDLALIRSIDTDGNTPSLLWDTSDPAQPIINIAVSEDANVTLQRRTENGDIAWTTTIDPNAEDAAGSGLQWIQLRIDGIARRCMLAMVSNGRIVVTSPSGKVLYRGDLAASDALVNRNDGDVIGNFAVADLNGDGTDEIYIGIDTHLLRLTQR